MELRYLPAPTLQLVINFMPIIVVTVLLIWNHHIIVDGVFQLRLKSVGICQQYSDVSHILIHAQLIPFLLHSIELG